MGNSSKVRGVANGAGSGWGGWGDGSIRGSVGGRAVAPVRVPVGSDDAGVRRVFYRPARPTLDGRTLLALSPLEFLDALSRLIPPPRVHRHRYHGVLARIYEVFPLRCPECGAEMRILVFLTDPEPIPELDLGVRPFPVPGPRCPSNHTSRPTLPRRTPPPRSGGPMSPDEHDVTADAKRRRTE